jgi:hypothetical protein
MLLARPPARRQEMAEVTRCKGGSRMSLNLRPPCPLGYTASRGKCTRGWWLAHQHAGVPSIVMSTVVSFSPSS